MKSNVKLQELARMRRRVLGLLGVGGAVVASCKSASDADGLVTAPMLETAASSVESVDAAVEGAALHRPMLEPHAPNGQVCTRDVHCGEALSTAPSWPFAHPYERCDPTPLGETGKFSPMETSQHRGDDPEACCYVDFSACNRRPTGRPVRPGRPVIGRPLRDDDDAWIVSRGETREDWFDDAVAHARIEVDEARVAFWAEGGALEHASVAEFSRLSLVLLAHGAPAELVADVHRAALDEIAHARTCFAIASRYAGRVIGPGALDVARASGDVSLEALVRSTLRDGCLGESAASVELAMLARDEIDPHLAAIIARMARDEERHAELAWRIVRFAMTVDEALTRRELARFMTALGEEPLNAVERDVARELVRPCLGALLNECATT